MSASTPSSRASKARTPLQILIGALKGTVVYAVHTLKTYTPLKLLLPASTATADPKIQTVADFSKIRYSQVWEDTGCLRKALRIKEGETILSIASAGDNVLGLLLDGPKKVIALDFSDAQLALVALKLAAIKTLDHHEFLQIIGFTTLATHFAPKDDAQPLPKPSELYKTKVREALDTQYRPFWDGQLDLLDQGISHTGRLEKYFGMWRKNVLPLTHTRAQIEAYLTAPDLETQKKVAPTGLVFDMLFKLYYGKTVLGWLGRDKAFFKHVKLDVGQTVLDRFKHSCQTNLAKDNYYMHYIFLGDLTPLLNTLPAYLLPESYPILKQRIDRIELVQSDIESFCLNPSILAPKSIDGFNLSDIFEWMSVEQSKSVYSALLRVANKDARIVYWNLFVERFRPEGFEDKVERVEEVAKECHAVDRTYFYTGFHVERLQGRSHPDAMMILPNATIPGGGGSGPAEEGSGQCKLMDGFAVVIQSLLALIAFGSLVYKRQIEHPPRPWLIWAFDTSKQVLASVLVHFSNVLFAYLTSSKGEEGEGMSGNPCVWYFLNILLDTTIGVGILYIFLRILHELAFRFGIRGVESGHYGNPPRISYWLKQTTLFILSWTLLKLLVLWSLSTFPFFSRLGEWVLKPVQRMGERTQVVFVMLVFPLGMNVVQAWLIDGVIKGSSIKGKKGGWEEEEDEEGLVDDEVGSAALGSLGGRERYVGLNDGDVEDED
ncbi:hypothetical protein HDV05_002288 [Chytridiales sp. JEL 0842]|nr:hypothetical protein HDV05_002288 [Chytridiales sp. JEL 0842]